MFRVRLAVRGTAREGSDAIHQADRETTFLVRQAQAGDVEAFACLAAAHEAVLGRFCRRLMGGAEEGADLAQEALLRAQQSIPRLGEPYRFGPWLLGIAANLAKKAWRAEARHPLSLDVLVATYPNVAWDESHTSVPSPEQISEEAMVLSGVTQRKDVAEFIASCFNPQHFDVR
jgi:DNA-directed RNA polymerase specialized sigma24 family protein